MTTMEETHSSSNERTCEKRQSVAGALTPSRHFLPSSIDLHRYKVCTINKDYVYLI